MITANFARVQSLKIFSLTRGLATASLQGLTSNTKLINWVEEKRKLLKPDNIHVITGTESEYNELCQQLVSKGVMEQLNPSKRPGSFLARTDPGDVARSEGSTYICSENKEDAGPTNNWVEPKEMRKRLEGLFDGSMKGRTMYVIPYSMGPVGSPLSKIGVEITDSAYVAVNMRIMTRVGTKVLEALGSNGDFVPCLHSVGAPLEKGQKDSAWPCNIKNRMIVHFPEAREIMSFGSGYGGNSLLGKKCFALRIASVIGRDEGWLAEHMLILGLTSPQGKKYYIAAAFPSACGKTNLAMMQPTIPGWKVECVGDDIAWMRFGKDGQLRAINPENGFFGVAPGTSYNTNPMAMDTITKNTIFTNVAKTEDNDVWWEGMTKQPPSGKMIDWRGQEWDKSSGPSSHPNSRFCVPASQCPAISPMFEDSEGVPISAIIFGGRRSDTVPLVFEAFNWQHGTFVGSSVASQMTAAAEGSVGALRFDPFAMLPFCGYNMGDYFQHWLNLGSKHKTTPKIFHVNWFRQEGGKFLWPGFGDNSRVLKWITQRIENEDVAEKTPIGYIPKKGTLDVEGLGIDKSTMEKLFSIEPKKWLNQVDQIAEYYKQFGNRLPKGISDELKSLRERLNSSL